MDLLIRLTPEMETGLEREAARLGVSPSEAAALVLQDRLIKARGSSVHALIDQIEGEDASDDPSDLAAREAEWTTLRVALDDDRLSNRPLFPASS